MSLQSVKIELVYSVDQPDAVRSFGDLHVMLDALRGMGIEPQVQVTGTDNAGRPAAEQVDDGGTGTGNGAARASSGTSAGPAPQTGRRRGRPAATPPAQTAAPVAGTELNQGNGLTDDDDADALGLSDPGKTPAELKEEALRIVRQVFNAGHTKEVKALQAALGVAKFYDVPDQDGHAFYRKVVTLAEQVGMRV